MSTWTSIQSIRSDQYTPEVGWMEFMFSCESGHTKVNCYISVSDWALSQLLNPDVFVPEGSDLDSDWPDLTPLYQSPPWWKWWVGLLVSWLDQWTGLYVNISRGKVNQRTTKRCKTTAKRCKMTTKQQTHRDTKWFRRDAKLVKRDKAITRACEVTANR